jgi:hypothetical protein
MADDTTQESGNNLPVASAGAFSMGRFDVAGFRNTRTETPVTPTPPAKNTSFQAVGDEGNSSYNFRARGDEGDDNAYNFRAQGDGDDRAYNFQTVERGDSYVAPEKEAFGRADYLDSSNTGINSSPGEDANYFNGGSSGYDLPGMDQRFDSGTPSDSLPGMDQKYGYGLDGDIPGMDQRYIAPEKDGTSPYDLAQYDADGNLLPETNVDAQLTSGAVTKGEIPPLDELERRSHLSKAELARLLNIVCGKNINHYKAALMMLTKSYGGASEGGKTIPTITISEFEDWLPFTIDPQTYREFINKNSGSLKNANLLKTAKEKTPAGVAGNLNDVGQLGRDVRGLARAQTSCATGRSGYLPAWASDILKRHDDNGFVQGLTRFCDAIHTHAWMKCFSIGGMGGLSQAVHHITGAVQNFFHAMNDIYQGVKLVMLQAQLFVEEIINSIQVFIQNRFLNGLIGLILAIACLILSTIQGLLDDIGFFASMFGGADSVFQALNSIQNVVNIGSQAINYITNPISAGFPAMFPKAAANVMNFVKNIGSLPEHLMGHLLKNFKGNIALHNRGMAIANTIVQRYGMQAQLGDLGPILQTFGTASPASKWHRGNNPVRSGPTSFFPNSMSNWFPQGQGLLNYDANGIPRFNLEGGLNKVSNIFDIQNNPYFQNAQAEVSSFKYNVASVGDVLKRPFQSNQN